MFTSFTQTKSELLRVFRCPYLDLPLSVPWLGGPGELKVKGSWALIFMLHRH